MSGLDATITKRKESVFVVQKLMVFWEMQSLQQLNAVMAEPWGLWWLI
jgi:hypothetical protein